MARSAEFGRRLTLLAEGDESENIRWYETQGKGFRLHQTPLQVADIFQSHLQQRPAVWVFTSATLAVGERLDHFARQLGIGDACTERWESPFDYGRQALWFRTQGYAGSCQRGLRRRNRGAGGMDPRIQPRGRAFLLFTSHRALRAAAHSAGVTPSVSAAGARQRAPQAELLKRFRRLGNAVLLGTASF